MLGKRLISAAVIVGIMVLLLRLDFWLGTADVLGKRGLLLAGLGVLLAAMAADELAAMFANAACRVNRISLLVAAVVMAVISVAPAFWRAYPADCVLGRFGFGMSGLVAGFVIVMIGEMARFKPVAKGRGEVIERMGGQRVCADLFKHVYHLFYGSSLSWNKRDWLDDDCHDAGDRQDI